ncbi:MAG: hypothetical protein OEV80_16490, partial [candidate division Zixibacteria bacterium]|nr:hypothetical protein [candidate division Zixibacteria bacterium]
MPDALSKFRIPLLLQKLELLRQVRNGIFARLFGYRLVSMKAALTVKAAIVPAYVGLTCLVLMLTNNDFGTATRVGQSLATYHHSIINGGALLLFYLGMFVGAVQISELITAENERLLSYPMVVSDLVYYRVMDMWLVVIRTCLYFVLPGTGLTLVAMGWSLPWTIVMTAMTMIFVAAAYLVGVNVVLTIARGFPRLKSDRIFIGIFVISGVLLVVGIRLFKAGYVGSPDVSLWAWLNQQLALGSYSSMMDAMILRPWGTGQAVLSLVAGGGVLYCLSRLSVRSFRMAFHRIHTQAGDMAAQAQGDTLKIGFATLNRGMKLLPLDARTLLVKDILNLIRKPHLVVKSIVFVGALALLANWKVSLLDDLFLFVLYLSSNLVVSRLFLNIIGQERGNILLIKQLYPTVWRYLSARVTIAFVVSAFVLILFWCLLIGLSEYFTLLDIL